MKIEDSVLVITGGASGLGEAAVRKVVSEGGKAVLFDLAEEKGHKLVEELGENVQFVQTDVTDEASVKQAVDQAKETFGGIHGLINCAGIGRAEKTYGKKGVDFQPFSQQQA